MNHVIVKPHGLEDGEWSDIAQMDEKNVIFFNTQDGKLTAARLPNASRSGKSTVMLRMETPNGKVVVWETTLAIFMSIASAFRAAEESFPNGLPPEGAVH